MQNEKPIAFYSRKLNSAQRNYTTGEQELLSIVETLKEFRNILLGQELIVHTDHMNIVYGNLTNARIARWRLLLEEFGPEYRHIAGKQNVVADALSRMEANFDRSPKPIKPHAHAQLCAYALSHSINDESVILPNPKSPEEMAYAFGEKDTASEKFPLLPRLIAKEQAKDKALQRKALQSKKEYTLRPIEGESLITTNNRIVLPKSLQQRVIAWYHEYLCHPGVTRMEATLGKTLYWPNMRDDIKSYVKSCRKCQLCKKQRKNYGLIPEKQAEPGIPWNRVNLDMVGPWTVRTPSGKKEQLIALTMIDPATGWFEIRDVETTSAEACSNAFDDVWLSRYPRPEKLGYDNGSEFKETFEEMRKNYGMKKKLSSSYNPQSNGIIERVHQVLGDMLRTFELEERELDPRDPWGSVLSAVGYAIRSTVHTTLDATPSQLVFGRDMLLPLKLETDWAVLQERRQKEIRRNNLRENSKRIPHTYQVGDKVTLDKPGILRKMSTPRRGPYNVERVFTNGTIRIRRRAVAERVNIRRVQPYVERQ